MRLGTHGSSLIRNQFRPGHRPVVFVLSLFAVRIKSALLSFVRVQHQTSHYPQSTPSLPDENNDHPANLNPTPLCATRTNTYHTFSKSSPIFTATTAYNIHSREPTTSQKHALPIRSPPPTGPLGRPWCAGWTTSGSTSRASFRRRSRAKTNSGTPLQRPLDS